MGAHETNIIFHAFIIIISLIILYYVNRTYNYITTAIPDTNHNMYNTITNAISRRVSNNSNRQPDQ